MNKKSILAVAIASLVLAVNVAAFSAAPKSDKGGCCPHEGSAAYKKSVKSSVHGKHAVAAKKPAVSKSTKRAHSTSQEVKCCAKDICKTSQCTKKVACEKKNGKCAESCCAKLKQHKAGSAGQMHGCPMDKKSNAAPAHGKPGGGCPMMNKGHK